MSSEVTLDEVKCAAAKLGERMAETKESMFRRMGREESLNEVEVDKADETMYLFTNIRRELVRAINEWDVLSKATPGPCRDRIQAHLRYGVYVAGKPIGEWFDGEGSALCDECLRTDDVARQYLVSMGAPLGDKSPVARYAEKAKYIIFGDDTIRNIRRNGECSKTPLPTLYVEQFETFQQIFALGECIVRTYTHDTLKKRNKAYDHVVSFQKMARVTFNEDYLRTVLSPELFANYLCVKEAYIHAISLGDTYDQEINSFYFPIEAAAYRAYLLIVLQLIYLRGALFKAPLPKRLVKEMYVYGAEPDMTPGPPCRDGKEDHRRPQGRVVMNFKNDYAGDFDDE